MATDLMLRRDDQDTNFVKWLEQGGEKTFPDIGKRTWRVPPVRFQPQKFSDASTDNRGNLNMAVLGLPPETDQESNQAENLVFSAFERLSDYLVQNSEDNSENALFIITNYEYQNYLNKLDIGAWQEQKQRRSLPPGCGSGGSDGGGGGSGGESAGGGSPPSSDAAVIAAATAATIAATGTDQSEKNTRRHSDTSLVKLPSEVARRGELDGLVLHKDRGIILIQIKSVGYDLRGSTSSCLTDEYLKRIEKAVTKATDQLKRDYNVMHYILNDVTVRSDHMTFLIALPNITREQFRWALDNSSKLKEMMFQSELRLDPNNNFLLTEDFHLEAGLCKNLYRWWTDKLPCVAKPTEFNLTMMKRIIFRTVGLLSTVSVWTWRKPRCEVRSLNEATWETGNRFSDMILSPLQAKVLKQEDRLLYIWGAPGSGKTLLLSLKGRQWQTKKCHVVILNTRLGSKGRDVGQVIERTVNTSGGDLKATRIDFDLMTDPTVLENDLMKLVNSNKPIRFIVDEVTWMKELTGLLDFLKALPGRGARPKPSVIWCAGMIEELCPDGFSNVGLNEVIRCPPSVQRLLSIVDNREERCKNYHTTSASAGLSTDGPIPFFVIHKEHGPPSVLPYDCTECARLVAQFLNENLQVSSSNNLGLDFRDVVLPVTMPTAWHRYNTRGNFSLSQETLALNMHLMGSSVFCTELLELGIPIQVEKGMRTAIDPHDQDKVLTMCPIGRVHGLEYKVVICMPNFCALKQETNFNEGIFQAENGPWVKMKRTAYGDALVARHPVFEGKDIKEKMSGAAHALTPDNDCTSIAIATREAIPLRIDQLRISTHTEGLPTDLLYEPISPDGEGDDGSPNDVILSNEVVHTDVIASNEVAPNDVIASNKVVHTDVTSLNEVVHTEVTPLNVEDNCIVSQQVVCLRQGQTHPDVKSPRNGRIDSEAAAAVVAAESMSGGKLPLPLQTDNLSLLTSTGQLPTDQRPSNSRSGTDRRLSDESLSDVPPPLKTSRSERSLSEHDPSNADQPDTTKCTPLKASRSERSLSEHDPSNDDQPDTKCTPLKASRSERSLSEHDPANDHQPDTTKCTKCLCTVCMCRFFKESEMEALHRLSQWDKAYVLLCASRSTAQLIMVLP